MYFCSVAFAKISWDFGVKVNLAVEYETLVGSGGGIVLLILPYLAIMSTSLPVYMSTMSLYPSIKMKVKCRLCL